MIINIVYTLRDYCAVYADGKLVTEGYEIDLNKLFDAVGIKNTWAYVDEDWFETNYFPEKYEDVMFD